MRYGRYLNTLCSTPNRSWPNTALRVSARASCTELGFPRVTMLLTRRPPEDRSSIWRRSEMICKVIIDIALFPTPEPTAERGGACELLRLDLTIACRPWDTAGSLDVTLGAKAHPQGDEVKPY